VLPSWMIAAARPATSPIRIACLKALLKEKSGSATSHIPVHGQRSALQASVETELLSAVRPAGESAILSMLAVD
jgi:hypothetical protein